MGKKEILILGAGNVGRGVVGGIFSRHGWLPIFYRRNTEFLQQLKETGEYTVWQGSAPGARSEMVRDFAVVAPDALEEQAAKTDLIAVCVYEPAIEEIGSQLADAFSRRAAVCSEAVCNLLICMNSLQAADNLRKIIRSRLGCDSAAEEYFQRRVGLVPVLVMSGAFPAPKELDLSPFALCVTDGAYLEAERSAFCEMPDLPPEVHLVENVRARQVRKLYLANMMHTAAAYLGERKGYRTIGQCYSDGEVRREVTAAFQEAEAGVLAEYAFDPAEHAAWRTSILGKMDVPVEDLTVRITSNSWKKLGRTERLLGPALLCAKHGVPYRHLTDLAAAAFTSHQQTGNCPHCFARKNGIWKAMQSVCGLTDESSRERLLQQRIAQAYFLLQA